MQISMNSRYQFGKLVRFCGYSWKISGFAQGARPEFLDDTNFEVFLAFFFNYSNHEVLASQTMKFLY